jgi:hypothetical protein
VQETIREPGALELFRTLRSSPATVVNVSVCIVSASDLTAKDAGGTSDPLCVGHSGLVFGDVDMDVDVGVDVAAWLRSCVAVWLCGCVAVWLCGCVAVVVWVRVCFVDIDSLLAVC